MFGSLFYLHLAGVDLMPAVLQLIYPAVVLRSADTLLFLLILLVLSSLAWRVEAVGTEALQQRSHGLRFGQLGDFEVLLVVWCVLSYQALLHGPLVLLVAPLAVVAVLFVVLVPTSDDGFFCKAHAGLEEQKGQKILEFYRKRLYLFHGFDLFQIYLNVLHLHLIKVVLILRGTVIHTVLRLRHLCHILSVLVGGGRQRAVGHLGVMALIGDVTEPFFLKTMTSSSLHQHLSHQQNVQEQHFSLKREKKCFCRMYLWVQGLIFLILSGCVGFISPLLDHLLHHLQLTGVRCGSALKALKKINK